MVDALVVAILLLLQWSSFGRYELADLLGTSQANVRGVLERLRDNDIIVSRTGRGGSTLTNKGIDLLLDLNRYVCLNYMERVFKHPDLKIEDSMESILIRTEVEEITGLQERDLAVRYGSRGAVTAIKMEENWFIPPEGNLEIDIDNQICDMITICFGKKSNLILSCIAIALHHVSHELDSIITKHLYD